MSTPAQIEANRRNAQASTGPTTPEGKRTASQNATKLGLFSSRHFVLPADRDEYNELSNSLWEHLTPQGPLEGAFAIEVIRATWRLRRCANVEADLEQFAGDDDALMNAGTAPTQLAVDRARTQALGVLNRALAELRRLQTERQLRVETLPAQIEPATLGAAACAAVSNGIAASVRAGLLLGKAEEIRSNNEKLALLYEKLPGSVPDTEGTPTPRNALCPCGSGQKYKRCCGVGSPAVLHQSAA